VAKEIDENNENKAIVETAILIKFFIKNIKLLITQIIHSKTGKVNKVLDYDNM
jgi:hypothetical protein